MPPTEAAKTTAVAEGDIPILAPMPGTVVRYEVNTGDSVKAGDVIVVFEAMKMENSIPAPSNGVVKAVNYSSGASVKKGDVLAIIAGSA